MRLGQGYIVAWYLSRSLVTWLLLQYLANNCQQAARRGIQGQTYIPGVFLFMAAAAFRMLWSVCLQQIQITFCTCIGQHENITSHFALFTITPHKLLMSEFRPCYIYVRNTGIIQDTVSSGEESFYLLIIWGSCEVLLMQPHILGWLCQQGWVGGVPASQKVRK